MTFLLLLVSQTPFAENTQYAEVTYFGVAYPVPPWVLFSYVACASIKKVKKKYRNANLIANELMKTLGCVEGHFSSRCL